MDQLRMATAAAYEQLRLSLASMSARDVYSMAIDRLSDIDASRTVIGPDAIRYIPALRQPVDGFHVVTNSLRSLSQQDPLTLVGQPITSVITMSIFRLSV